MNIENFDTNQALSERARDLVIGQLRVKPNLTLCAATGDSPTLFYELLAASCKKQPELFSELRIMKLDEWGGMSPDQKGTCEQYIREKILDPMGIPEDRYFGFRSNPEDPEEECRRVQNFMKKNGRIDICILGIGMDGHLALNEPGPYLQPYCHVASLTQKTLTHPMISELGTQPRYGLTLGMSDILQSRMIIMLISGKKKAEITKAMMEGKITTEVPASFLWLHPNVHCLICPN
jgi:galactosamine-6-phosphate isomerase